MKKRAKKFPYLYILALIFLIILFLIGFLLSLSQQNSGVSAINFTGVMPEENLINRKLVHISGEIINPGVYEFENDMRIAEVIELAGGLTENADKQFISEKINLAQKLKDEQKIYIPSIKVFGVSDEASVLSENYALVNINNATLEQLDSLPGIGPATAQKIIDARPFESIEELLDVNGIGDSKYSEIVNLVTI